MNELWHQAEIDTQLIADAANEFIAPMPIVDPEIRWLWLTLPNCGFATEVLRQQLGREGVTSRAAVNWSATGKNFSGHTVLSVDTVEGEAFVDTTYLQLFSEFGLDAHFVLSALEQGLGRVLPSEKSLVYTRETVVDVVDWLSGTTVSLLKRWQHSPLWQTTEANNKPLTIPSYQELGEFFMAVYDPEQFKYREQSPDKQLPIREYLETYRPGVISTDALFRIYRK